MRRHSFTIREKIRRNDEFKAIYKKGRKIITGYFVWFFLKCDSGGAERRLGITVAKAVGKAHDRNRIRRQIREYFRLEKARFPKGALVVKARMSAGNAANPELRKDLGSGAEKLIRHCEEPRAKRGATKQSR